MAKNCEECGTQLSFRNSFVFEGKSVCRNCLDKSSHVNKRKKTTKVCPICGTTNRVDLEKCIKCDHSFDVSEDMINAHTNIEEVETSKSAHTNKDEPTASKLFSVPWLPGFAFGFILFFLGMLQPDLVSFRFQYEYGHIVTLLIIVFATFVAFLISRKQKSLMVDNTIEFKIEKKKFGNFWGFLLGIVAAFVCVMIFEYLRNP